jgi:hypothetical protein
VGVTHNERGNAMNNITPAGSLDFESTRRRPSGLLDIASSFGVQQNING